MSLTAYRVVQESLTNVIKHSAATTAKVVVTATATELDLEITDPGPKRPDVRAGTAGHGLVGLDERARLVGGAVEYGARGAGFRVHATLSTAGER